MIANGAMWGGRIFLQMVLYKSGCNSNDCEPPSKQVTPPTLVIEHLCQRVVSPVDMCQGIVSAVDML